MPQLRARLRRASAQTQFMTVTTFPTNLWSNAWADEPSKKGIVTQGQNKHTAQKRFPSADTHVPQPHSQPVPH